MSSTSYKTPELICMRKMQGSLYSYTRDDKRAIHLSNIALLILKTL